MSKHEGFRFWENLEKKSGSQELPNRLLSSVYCSVFTCTIPRHLGSAPEIGKRNKASSQGPEEEGQRKKEEGATSLSKSEGVRPADLARLEKVVSKLELEVDRTFQNRHKALRNGDRNKKFLLLW